MSTTAAVLPALQAIVCDLVSAEHLPDASFIHLPMAYPGGSFVTVRIDRLDNHRFRVSDGGFGFRQVEEIGAQRSFARVASTIAEESDLARNARAFFLEVPERQLARAITDVGAASWQLVDRIYARYREDDDEEIVEHLADRLEAIFGKAAVEQEATLVGASTSPWELTAVVKRDQKVVAFQAVGVHANSVYRANAAFDDLSALDNPPGLVAVVHSKSAFGPKLTLLARSARIIEEDQPDAVFVRAAA